MPKLSKRETILLIILLITIVGYCYYTYILTPQLSNLDAINQKLEDDRVALSELQVSQKNIDNIKKEVDDLNKRAEESEKSIPDASRIPEIIMDFKNVSDASGCTVGKLSFNPAVKNPAKNNTENKDAQKNAPVIMVIPITFQASGNYNNIMLLLKGIENSDRKMAVDRISINKDEGTGILTADLSINCFYMDKTGTAKIDYTFLNIPSGKQDIFN